MSSASESVWRSEGRGPTRNRALPAVALWVVTVLLLGPLPAHGGAFLSREEALELAFPGAARIETRSFVLTDEQSSEVARRTGAPLESKLVSVQVGRGTSAGVAGALLGYALIDVHTVRTQPEAIMVVLDPGGAVRSVRLLAFYEPSEYIPPDRWRDQFDGVRLTPDLRVGGKIYGVAGATLSSRATTRTVRRALAIYEVLLSGRGESPAERTRAPRAASPEATE